MDGDVYLLDRDGGLRSQWLAASSPIYSEAECLNPDLPLDLTLASLERAEFRRRDWCESPHKLHGKRVLCEHPFSVVRLNHSWQWTESEAIEQESLADTKARDVMNKQIQQTIDNNGGFVLEDALYSVVRPTVDNKFVGTKRRTVLLAVRR